MTPGRQRTLARAMRLAAAAVILLAVTALTADFIRASRRASADAERIASLQALAHADSTYAPQVAAAQDEVSRTRRARKARTTAAADVLIVACALFIAAAKWPVALEGRRVTTVVPLASLRISSRTAGVRPQRSTTGVNVGSDPVATAGVDLSAVDRIIAAEGRGKESAIPILQAIQAHFRYLPDEALARVCETTEVTPAQVAGTSSFYARFRRSPVGEHIVRVCHGTACHVAGARQITDELRRQLQIADGADTDPSRTFTIDEVACLGCCSLAPVLMVDDRTAGRLTPSTACLALDAAREVAPV